jgi:GntR family transcriptional regulator/MocR family aminotransferase
LRWQCHFASPAFWLLWFFPLLLILPYQRVLECRRVSQQSQLSERIKQMKLLTDEQASWPPQQILADFIARGHLDRHIRRMRQQYAQKRSILAQTLAPIRHLARLRGLEAGLHAYLELGAQISATHIALLARKRNVIVTPLDAYYLGPPDRSGLLLGYASLEIPDIIRGATVLMEIIEQVAALSHSS